MLSFSSPKYSPPYQFVLLISPVGGKKFFACPPDIFARAPPLFLLTTPSFWFEFLTMSPSHTGPFNVLWHFVPYIPLINGSPPLLSPPTRLFLLISVFFFCGKRAPSDPTCSLLRTSEYSRILCTPLGNITFCFYAVPKIGLGSSFISPCWQAVTRLHSIWGCTFWRISFPDSRSDSAAHLYVLVNPVLRPLF